MNQAIAQTTTVERSFFLSQVLGARVILRGKKTGRLKDLVIKENGSLPVVTHLYVALPFGETALIPWEKINSFERREIILAEIDLAAYKKEPDEKILLLKDYILDKKAIDLDGREMEVVYDIRLALKNNRLYVTEVDLSRYGLLRRMGLAWLADFIYKLAEDVREQTISWTYIEPLPENIGSFRGNLQLKVLKEALEDMQPVDLADILEELDHDQRVQIFTELDPEQASDTLEEIDPYVQRDLVSSLERKKVAQLIDDMTPGQAADVISVLSDSDADDIIALLEPEKAQKVRAIIEHQEENILDFTTQEFLSFSPHLTAERALDEYRMAARGKDVVMYLYIQDKQQHLLGVADVKDVLQAEDKTLLEDIMNENAISLESDTTLKEALRMFTRYNFRALPVVDEENKMVGVVPYRDIVGLKHHFVE